VRSEDSPGRSGCTKKIFLQGGAVFLTRPRRDYERLVTEQKDYLFGFEFQDEKKGPPRPNELQQLLERRSWGVSPESGQTVSGPGLKPSFGHRIRCGYRRRTRGARGEARIHRHASRSCTGEGHESRRHPQPKRPTNTFFTFPDGKPRRSRACLVRKADSAGNAGSLPPPTFVTARANYTMLDPGKKSPVPHSPQQPPAVRVKAPGRSGERPGSRNRIRRHPAVAGKVVHRCRAGALHPGPAWHVVIPHILRASCRTNKRKRFRRPAKVPLLLHQRRPPELEGLPEGLAQARLYAPSC